MDKLEYAAQIWEIQLENWKIKKLKNWKLSRVFVLG
jgi:hypothetical protein